MAAKKYQIFVSSTFRDLVQERQATIRDILDLNHIPAGMELFPAADVDQLEYIKKVIDECDYYLLIVGGRYGSLDAEGVSFTEREYDYAVATNKFVIAFVHGEPGAISVSNSDIKPELITALNAFRTKVMTGRLVRLWNDQKDLQVNVVKALMYAFNNHPQTGWIRGDSAASDDLLEKTNKALQENSELKAKIEALSANQPAEISGIVGLDDIVKIKARTRTYSSSYGTTYQDREFKFLLSDIFVYVASDLSAAKTEIVFELAIIRIIKDKFGLSNLHDVDRMDVATIKVQFLALGLIEGQLGPSVKGTVHEYLQLTERGKRVFIERMVLKKGDPN